ncbi:hypothetical protein ACFE04_003021 [Oxalis oulophora]
MESSGSGIESWDWNLTGTSLHTMLYIQGPRLYMKVSFSNRVAMPTNNEYVSYPLFLLAHALYLFVFFWLVCSCWPVGLVSHLSNYCKIVALHCLQTTNIMSLSWHLGTVKSVPTSFVAAVKLISLELVLTPLFGSLFWPVLLFYSTVMGTALSSTSKLTRIWANASQYITEGF